MGNWNLIKFLKFWFPVILYSGIIFYVSSIPDLTTPLPETQFDKILHIFEYMPFGFLMAHGICGYRPSISKRATWVLVVSVSLVYGMSDEIHQSFVPGRNAGVADFVADTIGGALGGALYLYLLRKNIES